MSGTDSGERTEKATPERLRRAVRKGQIGRSQDFTAWVCIGAAAVMIPSTVDAASRALSGQMAAVSTVARDPDPSRAVEAIGAAVATVGEVLLPLLLVVLVATTATAIAQGGIRLRGVPLRAEQFDIVAGLKRIVGKAALWEGAKALLKTAAIGAALWIVVAGLVPVLMGSGRHTASWLLERAGGGVATLLQVAVAVGLLLAAVDVFVVMKRNRQHTRMTKQEARDEHKKSEGDPLIRSQRRARQMAMSRNRMIAAVADSDVVLLNPTHIAVALRYEPGRSAPRVVAKGAGVIAQKIRERAEGAGVPMVRDVALARALHAAVEVGHEIPEHLYTAVAQVLAFVQQLTKRGSRAGTHTMPPAALVGRDL